MGQPVAWFEILSPDPEQAKKSMPTSSAGRWRAIPDIDAYLEPAVALGGAQFLPPTDLPGDFGKFAIFAGPDGNQVGLWA